MGIKEKFLHIWITNKTMGNIKYRFYKFLQKKYHFNQWHCTPINERRYAIKIVEYINSMNNVKSVFEIGCGLGEILNNIKAKKLKGYDIEKEVLRAARILNRKVNYSRGSFNKIRNEIITYLITVNFIHLLSPEQLKRYYEKIIQQNQVKYIVADEVNSPEYKYNHKMDKILPKNFQCIKKIGPFEAFRGIRYIVIFENKDLNNTKHFKCY